MESAYTRDGGASYEMLGAELYVSAQYKRLSNSEYALTEIPPIQSPNGAWHIKVILKDRSSPNPADLSPDEAAWGYL
jgi:hypothetical protein